MPRTMYPPTIPAPADNLPAPELTPAAMLLDVYQRLLDACESDEDELAEFNDYSRLDIIRHERTR